MIKYPNNYFQDEVRCGFRITEMMKRCWAAQIKILMEIERICKKYGLKYYAAYGSLLGAVRHKGYIPWDDDMDIWMKRKDYMILMGVIKKELPEEYDLLSIYNNNQWINTFSRITNSKTVPLNSTLREEFYGFPLLAGIDIFPIDCIPRNQEIKYAQQQLLNLAWRMIANLYRDMDEKYTDEQRKLVRKELAESIEVFSEFCSIPDMKGKTPMQVMQLIFDQLCMIGIEENSDTYAYMSTLYENGYCVNLQKNWFDDVIEMPFEYGHICVPTGYDEILREQYGNSYMKYVRDSAGHNYPYFLNQIEELKKANAWNLKMDPKDEGVPDEIKPIPGGITEILDVRKDRINLAKKEGKRVVLLQPMQTFMLAFEERYVEAMEVLLENFIKNPRVLIWFRPHLNEHVPYEDVKPELFKSYRNLCEKYANSPDIIYDISDNQMGAIELCDVYVGEESYISDEFEKRNKKCFYIDVKSKKLEQFVKNF